VGYTMNLHTAVEQSDAGSVRTYKITTTPKVNASSIAARNRLSTVNNDEWVREQLRAAAVETLIKRMKFRFAESEDSMKNLVKAKDNSGKYSNKGSKHRLDSSPKFATRMQQAYRAIFDETGNFGKVGVGWGPMDAVEKVKTPTNRGKPTKSPYTTMWKQLEFGTGVWAVKLGGPHARTSGRYKFADGSWVYGRVRRRSGAISGYRGLRLIGTQPGSFLWDTDGTPYTRDLQELQAAFYQRLRTQLKAN
jgi:hypothetical protein